MSERSRQMQLLELQRADRMRTSLVALERQIAANEARQVELARELGNLQRQRDDMATQLDAKLAELTTAMAAEPVPGRP